MAHFKKIISSFLIIAIVISTFAFSSSLNVLGATNKLVHIFGTDVNFRSSMSLGDSSKICLINNDYADLISQSGNWLYINYNYNGTMTKGYVYNNDDWIRIVDFDPNARDTAFEQQISAFPESYKASLRKLHALYPNWKFTAVSTNSSIEEITALQLPKLAENPSNETLRKLVSLKGHPISWRSMGMGAYDWGNEKWVDRDSGWTGASKEVVNYYLDPRNFLYPSGMFMFMKQTTSASNATESDVQQIVNKTFMKNGYTTFSGDAYGGSYAKVLLEAGKQSGVDPCVLAAIIWQEQGSGTSDLISGNYSDSSLKGYYNFFNISASAATGTQLIINGLTYAKNQGWNTIPKSIIGGATFVKDKYINGGQDTFFYQNYNVNNPSNIWHQYASNVADSYSKGYFAGTAYFDKFNYYLEFRIPVYKDMPETNYARPVENNKVNNYYFNDISVSGLTPSFDRYTYSYSLKVSGDTALTYKLPDKATLASAKSYSLNQGINNVVLTVKAETGYTSDYTISVNAETACTLYITTDGKIPGDSGGSSTPSTPTYLNGDTNNDGVVDIIDLAKVQMHILKIKTLSGAALTAGDTNSDGIVDIVDLAKVQMHILKIKLLK